MKVAALALLLLMAWAAPASAQFTPTVVPFVNGQQTPVIEKGVTIGSECGGVAQGSGGWDGGAYLPADCGYPSIHLDKPMATVEFFVRIPSATP
jgi:hypothetical protein